jgi:hypothetical protein
LNAYVVVGFAGVSGHGNDHVGGVGSDVGVFGVYNGGGGGGGGGNGG